MQSIIDSDFDEDDDNSDLEEMFAPQNPNPDFNSYFDFGQ